MRTARVAIGRRSAAIAVAAGFMLLSACSDGGDEASPSDLIGTWEVAGAGVAWEITEDVIAATTPAGPVQTAYTATATTLEMGEESGEFACNSGQIGVYEWEIEDDVLTVTLVSDDCSGRGEIVDGTSLARTE